MVSGGKNFAGGDSEAWGGGVEKGSSLFLFSRERKKISFDYNSDSAGSPAQPSPAQQVVRPGDRGTPGCWRGVPHRGSSVLVALSMAARFLNLNNFKNKSFLEITSSNAHHLKITKQNYLLRM